jgi:hypothetical protein
MQIQPEAREFNRSGLRLLTVVLSAIALQAAHGQGAATSEMNCTAEGYRVVAQRWDAILNTGWELRQNCLHPEWPVRLAPSKAVVRVSNPAVDEAIPTLRSLLVHAGDRVRLWAQSERVRVEMSGRVEQSGRNGDHVIVQITRHSDEPGSVPDRLPGIVRGVDDVEMEQPTW